MNNLEYAIKLHEKFPKLKICFLSYPEKHHPDKKTRNPKGMFSKNRDYSWKQSRSDVETITRFYNHYYSLSGQREPNVGINLNPDCGFCVLDIDNKKGSTGSKELIALEKKYGKLPVTPIDYTPCEGEIDENGKPILGEHRFFKIPDGFTYELPIYSKRNSGLELFFDEKYVMMPPSIVYSESNSIVSYASNPDHNLFNTELAELPQWVIDFFVNRKKADVIVNKNSQPRESNSPFIEWLPSCYDVATGYGFKVIKTSGANLIGSHPYDCHGSTTGDNFSVNTLKDCFKCHRCHKGSYNVLDLIAICEGIIDCSQAGNRALTGKMFIDVAKIAIEKFGAKINLPEKKYEPKMQNNEDPSDKKLKELDMAKYIVEEKHVIFSSEKQYYVYISGVYERREEEQIVKVITDIYGSLKIGVLNCVIKYIKSQGFINFEKMNPDNLLNLENGYYDVDKFTFSEGHSPKILSSVRIPIKYDPSALCKSFEDGVFQIINDHENVMLLQEFFGLCLTRKGYEKAIILYGPKARNGKTQLQNILRGLVGPKNYSGLSLAQFENTHQIMELKDKTVNVSAELSSRYLVDDSILKRVITQDIISGSYKHKPEVSFVPSAKLIFSVNELPMTSDKTAGFKDRLLIIKCDQRFDGVGRSFVMHIWKTWIPELPGILNWALIGLQNLTKRSYFADNKNTISERHLFNLENNSAAEFLHEMCIYDRLKFDMAIPKRILWERYVEYYKDNNADITLKPMGLKFFNKTVEREFDLCPKYKKRFTIEDGVFTNEKWCRAWQFLRIKTADDLKKENALLESCDNETI